MAKKVLASPFVPVEEQPYKIPENWCWVYWGDIGEFTAGSGFKNEYQGFGEYQIPFYKVGSLKYSDENGVLYDNSNTINEEIRVKLKATLIPSQSIIFAKIGEAIRLNRRSINAVPCCIDNNLMAFQAKGCFWRYAFYWTLGLDLYMYINATTVPAIRKSDLEAIPFPLPPIPEQHRIVNRIESLFAKLDETKEKAQAVVDGFELRKSAILHKAFTGELTEQWRKEHGVGLDGWKNATLSEIVSGFKYGTSEKSTYNNTGMPVLRIPNVGAGTLSFEDMKYLAHNDVDETNQVHENDLLIIRSNGSRDLVGKCAIVPALSRKFAYASFLIRIKPSERILPDYLAFYLNSTDARTQMFKKTKSSAGIHNINSQELGSITINVPTIYEQSAIIAVLNNLLAKEQQAKDAAEAVLTQIDTMKKAILARAFRGELGTNDPAEEWAGELVREILKTEVPPQPRARAVFIPKEFEKRLESELERKIIKLYLKSDSATLSIDVLMAVSSKKFEVMDALRNLEQRGIIKKLNNGNYSLVR